MLTCMPLALLYDYVGPIRIKDHGMSGLTNQRICHSVHREGACMPCMPPATYAPTMHAPNHARPLPCMPCTMHSPSVKGQSLPTLCIVLLLMLEGLYFCFKLLSIEYYVTYSILVTFGCQWCVLMLLGLPPFLMNLWCGIPTSYRLQHSCRKVMFSEVCVTVWQTGMSVCSSTGLGPCPMVNFSDLVNWNRNSVSQPIRSESDDLMSGWVLYSMLDITTPPPLYVCCFWVICLDTGVQPQLNLPCVLILPLGPGALGGASQGLCCLVEVSPLIPSPHK